MIKEVLLTVVEAVQCKHHGVITIQMCRKCPYFGGYRGFKKISCRRGDSFQVEADI